MGFLRAELAQHVAADGIGEEGVTRTPEDRDEPWQDEHEEPDQAPDRSHTPQPCRRAVEEGQDCDCQPDEHQDQRALEQDAAGQCRPEDRGRRPRRMRRILAALPGQIHPRQCAHRRGDGEQQQCVGLGQPSLGAKQHGGAHHQRGERCAAPRHEGQCRPVSQEHRADGTDQRRNAVEPDAHLRPRQAKRGSGLDGRRLQPVDADRLLVADIVLEADIDEIAGLDHLLGRLGEPRLIAIDGRNGEKSGQEKQQAAQRQERNRAPVTGGREVECGEQPAAGIRRFDRLLACSKTPDLGGFNHADRIR